MVSPQKYLREKDKPKEEYERKAFDMTDVFMKQISEVFREDTILVFKQLQEHVEKFGVTKTHKGQCAGVVNGQYYHVRYYRHFADVPVFDSIEKITENDYLEYVLHGLAMQ